MQKVTILTLISVALFIPAFAQQKANYPAYDNVHYKHPEGLHKIQQTGTKALIELAGGYTKTSRLLSYSDQDFLIIPLQKVQRNAQYVMPFISRDTRFMRTSKYGLFMLPAARPLKY